MTILPIGSPQNTDAGEHTVAIARDRGRRLGAGYAKSAAPTSPMPELTGNSHPGRSLLGWLKNRNKCNQFVGDVLTLAGYAMPTFRMRDGSKHFMHAEALINQPHYFERVGREVAPGDLLVIDRPGRGENSAHVEIVTGAHRSTDTPTSLTTIGALNMGVTEQDRAPMLKGARWNKKGGYFERGTLKAFFLRPRKTQSETPQDAR